MTIIHHHICSQSALNGVVHATQMAQNMDIEITACIVNKSGYVVAQLSTDNARFLTTELAFNKAYTAACFQRDTTELYHAFRDNGQLMQGFANRDSRLILFPGGTPITVDGECIGAVGISGGSAEQDIEIAQSVINTISHG